jgi:uncharacterized protein
MPVLTSPDSLARHYREPNERAIKKQLGALDPHCRRFIALSPFIVIATGDPATSLDASPRGGPPGFAQVQDDRTLLLPDWPGNNRLDTLRNILAAPAIGLLFLVPGVDEVLRVNGHAAISDDEQLRARFEIGGKRPATVIVVSVREAYLHCPKALMRAGLWDAKSRIERDTLPSLGQMINDQIGETAPAESRQSQLARYDGRLYEER